MLTPCFYRSPVHGILTAVLCAAFCVAGSLAAGAEEQVMTEPRLTLTGHASDLWAAAFSPDGHRVLSVSSDKTAKLWDAKSGALIATLEGHTEGLRNGAFSPDGTVIATVARDGLGAL